LYFRYCNVGILFDTLAGFMNVDPALILETVTRQGMAAFFDIPALWAKVEEYNNVPHYYNAGYEFGNILKLLLDFNINN